MSVIKNQYGGFTIANIDSLVAPYAEKQFETYKAEFLEVLGEDTEENEKRAEEFAEKKVKKDLMQGCQELEYKFNTVASSRGDFSFITCTFGLDTTKFGKMMSESLMETRVKGQGEPAVPMLFPKLVFMTSLDHLHGEGKPNHDLFLKACECSNQVMYPDFVRA